MLLITVLVVGAVPALGYVGVRAILDSEGGADATADNLPITTFPSTPTGLLLTNDGAGRLTSATILVLDPKGLGGSIISVPVSADFGLADDARQSLQGAYEVGGFDGTVDAAESLLGITINLSGELDPSGVAALLAPLAPITVDLPAQVPADGAIASIPAGSSQLTAEQAARVLTAKPAADGTGLEASRRPNVEATWVGVVAAVGGGKPTTNIDLAVPPTTLADMSARLFSGTVQTRGLTAQPLTAAQNPTGVDVEQLDRSEEVFVFASIAPGAMSPAAIGPTFRLVAPPGYDAAVKATIGKLLFFQANVVSVDTTAPVRADTIFYVPDDIVRTEAQQTDGIFGAITFGDPTERIDGVDITVLLGTDFLDKVATS